MSELQVAPPRDSGWVEPSKSNWTDQSWERLMYRRIGDTVYVHGGGTPSGVGSDNAICTLPAPRQNTNYLFAYDDGTADFAKAIHNDDGRLWFRYLPKDAAVSIGFSYVTRDPWTD